MRGLRQTVGKTHTRVGIAGESIPAVPGRFAPYSFMTDRRPAAAELEAVSIARGLYKHAVPDRVSVQETSAGVKLHCAGLPVLLVLIPQYL